MMDDRFREDGGRLYNAAQDDYALPADMQEINVSRTEQERMESIKGVCFASPKQDLTFHLLNFLHSKRLNCQHVAFRKVRLNSPFCYHLSADPHHARFLPSPHRGSDRTTSDPSTIIFETDRVQGSWISDVVSLRVLFLYDHVAVSVRVYGT
jgi:hypothetical protein